MTTAKNTPSIFVSSVTDETQGLLYDSGNGRQRQTDHTHKARACLISL